MYIEYDKVKNDDNVFVQYDLYKENYANDVLPASLFTKFQDSMCGVDIIGNVVPDQALSHADSYGISVRPRQSMVIDRLGALSTYLQKVNSVLIQYPIAETRSFPLLFSEEAMPPAQTGAWDTQLSNLEELSFQDLESVQARVPAVGETPATPGHKYLIETDEDYRGVWTVYEVQSNRELLLIRVQNYDTSRFWNYTNWYPEDFNPLTKPDFVVQTQGDLSTLTADNNATAKVISNSENSWEIYVLSDG